MRNSRKAVWLAGAAASLFATSAWSQEASPADGTEADAGNDIIVTARRREETLQDVPQTINAVSSDTIQKLRINNAADLTQVVPGISIEGSSSGSGGFGSSSSIRGVPTFLLSNASPVVQFYLNDAPTGRGPEAAQSLFDIGQIEVLKGPQGTLRGRSAPTGAITITSKRPDLNEVGGYVNLSGTTRNALNLQAAVNVPLVSDVLAVRVAGVVDHSEGSGVTSANNRLDPYAKREAFRATMRFEPGPAFSTTIMYQRLNTHTRSFSQVFGPGNGLPGAALNGPPIAPGDRLGITDQPGQSESSVDFVVGQAELRFAGQKLTYVGSYRNSRSEGVSPSDASNTLPGFEYFQQTSTPAAEASHELRLSSEERIAGLFDYVIGAFYDKEWSHPTVQTNGTFLSGAFGAPGATPTIQQPLSRYTISSFTTIDPVATEKSIFGSITAHLGDNTELSAGGRYINYKRHDRYSVVTLPAFNALPGFQCPFVPGTVPSPVYPGACDLPIAGMSIQNEDRRTEFNPLIYNVSLSHKFSPDFMVYGNVGSAFRSAGPSIGITGTADLTIAGFGSLQDLIFHGEERSTTYEIGFKASFFDRRLRLNVSAFKQKFNNFFFLTQSTRFLSISDETAFLNYVASLSTPNPIALPSSVSISSAEFTTDANAKVKGIDVEAAFQITPRWSLNVGYSWSKAQLDNALIPCNDSNFDGTPDTLGNSQTQAQQIAGFVGAQRLIARCRSNESISRTPNWNLTVQSEFSAPISDRTDAFLRGSLVYYPDNPNASQGVVIQDYAMLNLYTGIRSPNGDWEVSLFANNLLNTQQILSINPVAVSSSADARFNRPASGYQSIGYTPRREFGLNVRYAFGSR